MHRRKDVGLLLEPNDLLLQALTTVHANYTVQMSNLFKLKGDPETSLSFPIALLTEINNFHFFA